MHKKNDKDESKNHEFFVFLFFYITQKIPGFRGFLQHVLYQIGIRCLVATLSARLIACSRLYQIGIRCLVATICLLGIRRTRLYQIGIRCLVATKKWVGRGQAIIISNWN